MDISENTTFIGNSATDGGGVTYSSACMSEAMPLSLVTQLGLAEVSVHGPIAKWTSVRTLLLLETQLTMVAVSMQRPIAMWTSVGMPPSMVTQLHTVEESVQLPIAV